MKFEFNLEVSSIDGFKTASNKIKKNILNPTLHETCFV